jgi:hypothetical protein
MARARTPPRSCSFGQGRRATWDARFTVVVLELCSASDLSRGGGNKLWTLKIVWNDRGQKVLSLPLSPATQMSSHGEGENTRPDFQGYFITMQTIMAPRP